MRTVQGTPKESPVNRFYALSVRMGVAWLFGKKARSKPSRSGRTKDLKDGPVARVIEFYIPTRFPKRVKWVPPVQRGKVIQFSLPPKKFA
jgi:hypothetical protein